MRRVEKGSINLFSRKEYSTTYSDNSSNSHTGFFQSYSYSKGFNDLQSLTYENLTRDLLGEGPINPKKKYVFDQLEKGKKKKRLSRVLLAAGMGTFLVGTIMYASAPEDEGAEKPKPLRLIGLGISGIGIVGAVVSLTINPKNSYLKAIEDYNIRF